MVKPLVVSICLLSAACAQAERPSTHADWMKEATRVWPGETQARVIAAAEAVVRHADPRDVKIEYNRGGFTARRKFSVYAVLANVAGEDRWTFSSSENTEGASAAVRIVQRGAASAGSHSQRFRDNQTMVGSFRLFYARMDYLLGKRSDWITCAEAAEKLRLPKDAAGLEALCSLTHQGRDTPPPALQPKRGSASPKLGPPEPPQLPAEEPD
jgi:hypothetical protein